jgi:hypothetical protein
MVPAVEVIKISGCSRAVVPHMKRHQWGRIINVGSMMGITALPERVAYSAAKWGVHGVTKVLALELAPYHNPDASEVEAIVSGVKDPTQLIWEAPLKNQNVWLIKKFGINVNFGNIPPEEVLVLEALRNGMRGDTLKMAYLGKI